MTAAGATTDRGRGCDAAIAMGWCGPDEHGIPRVARQIADAATHLGFAGDIRQESDPARLTDLVDRLPAATRLLHLHVNDWLFADAGADADCAVTALTQHLADRRIRLSVTLHDLPQLSDGHALYRRRSDTYRLIARSAAGVVVSSEHERVLLREALTDAPSTADRPAPITPSPAPHPVSLAVIPLPIDPMPPRIAVQEPDGAGASTVGIFGYLYPGKGHREVLEEVVGMDPPLDVIAIGRASDRHTDLVDELTAVANRSGVAFRCTGYISDTDLPEQLRRVGVPLAPHTHVSASGSINSWIAAGRRPLVPAGRYVAELERRMPGAVWIYQPGELRRHLERAVAHPELTWLPTGLDIGPTTPMVAARYLDWLRQLAGTPPR
jgi:hypothetical protein